MLKNLLILPDGTEVLSGQGQNSAIKSLTYTESVNSAQDVVPGAVCAGMLQAELITPGGSLLPGAGEEIAWYRVDETGKRSLQGYFLLEKPERASANCLRMTGYDRVVKLDKDLTAWLGGLTAWPYAMEEFARLVCAQCGVELVEQAIPNGDFSIQKFTGEGITGRQILSWVGQIAGRFCRATREGKLEFAWYTPGTITLGPDDSYGSYYYQGSLKFQDYATQVIQKVQIRQNQADVGTVYPDTEGNTYMIEANPMLAALDGQTLLPVAKSIYELLEAVSYTPCVVTIPGDAPVSAGEILSITDVNGKCFTCYVMKRTLSGFRQTLECTGNRRRDDTTAMNSGSFQSLSGKVLNLRVDVDGIQAENRDMQGNFAALQLELQGISTQVSQNQEQVGGLKTSLSKLQQSADSLKLSLQQITENGVSRVTTTTGYTFDMDGLHIQKSGEQMENTLDNTGMVVRRSGTPILQATAEGVVATDVQVNNYLVIGSCRFEDYADGENSRRTACFFTG